MAFHYSPKIATDGLVLYLDAANTKSYPTTGTIWNSIGRTNISGSLTNGPMFSTVGGGSILFDGVNDRVDIEAKLQSYSVFTTSFWVNYLVFDSVSSTGHRTPIGDSSQLFGYHVLFLQGLMYLGMSSGFAGNPYTNPITHRTINTSTWYNFVITKNSSNDVTFYQNGTSLGTTNKAGLVNVNTIGRGYVNDNSRMTKIMFYDRALTADEVLQNFNTTKSRFGL